MAGAAAVAALLAVTLPPQPPCPLIGTTATSMLAPAGTKPGATSGFHLDFDTRENTLLQIKKDFWHATTLVAFVASKMYICSTGRVSCSVKKAFGFRPLANVAVQAQCRLSFGMVISRDGLLYNPNVRLSVDAGPGFHPRLNLSKMRLENCSGM